MNWFLFTIILTIISIYIVAIWWLMKSGQNLHEKLNAVEAEAKQAKTIPELEVAWENLKKVNKECWHRVFGTRVREIKAILETKFSMLS